jgi:GT2 family glycosyltransferase
VELIIIGRSLSGYSPIDETQLQQKFLKLSLYENFTTEQALEICNGDNCLVVIPSLIENCPYVVQELISQNSRVLATKVGGIPELINSENLVEPNIGDLQHAMQKFIEDSTSISKTSPLIDHKLISMKWINLFKNKIDFRTESQFKYRDISVIIAHYNQSNFLEAALESVARQTYSQFEVIVIDDGSDLNNRTEFNLIAKKWESEKFRFLSQENQDVGFTRNRGAKESNFEVICFLDADDLLEETALECFIDAMNSGAEISTSHFAIFLGDSAGTPKSKGLYGAYEPLGPIAALMWKENILGGANFAIRKKLFASLGGFTEVRKSNHQDWQFLTKAVLLGSDLRVIPKRLLNYRVTVDSMARTRSHVQGTYEVIDRYTESAPVETIREVANEIMKAHVYSTTSDDKIQFISSTFRLAQRLQRLAVAVSPYGSIRWKVLLPLYRRIVR